MAGPARIDQTGGAGVGDVPPVPAAPEPAEAEASSSNVLCTILDNGDGTYTLVKGDEDVDAGGASPDGGGAAGDGAPGADALSAGPAGAGTPQGQTFNSPGELLKGLLDLLNAKEAPEDAQADANFDAGFKGGSNMSSPKGAAPGMM